MVSLRRKKKDSFLGQRYRSKSEISGLVRPYIEEIEAVGSGEDLASADLKRVTSELVEHIAEFEDPYDAAWEARARAAVAVREAARRTLRTREGNPMVHYDVQIAGGFVLAEPPEGEYVDRKTLLAGGADGAAFFRYIPGLESADGDAASVEAASSSSEGDADYVFSPIYGHVTLTPAGKAVLEGRGVKTSGPSHQTVTYERLVQLLELKHSDPDSFDEAMRDNRELADLAGLLEGLKGEAAEAGQEDLMEGGELPSYAKGKVLEMRTGEGKTLVATLPLYVASLFGKGAWLATANDYLARRDAHWMGPVYAELGRTVGVVQPTNRSGFSASYVYDPDENYEKLVSAVWRAMEAGGGSGGSGEGFRGWDEGEDFFSEDGLRVLGETGAIPESVLKKGTLRYLRTVEAVLATMCLAHESEGTAAEADGFPVEARIKTLARFSNPDNYQQLKRFLMSSGVLRSGRHYAYDEGSRKHVLTEDGIGTVEDYRNFFEKERKSLEALSAGDDYRYNPQIRRASLTAAGVAHLAALGAVPAAEGDSNPRWHEAVSVSWGIANGILEKKFPRLRMASKKEAYGADITYGENKEFVFDMIRDETSRSSAQTVQRKNHPFYSLLDEVDDALIDEAVTPHILTWPVGNPYGHYERLAGMMGGLNGYEVRAGESFNEGELGWVLGESHYIYDPKGGHVTLTRAGKEYFRQNELPLDDERVMQMILTKERSPAAFKGIAAGGSELSEMASRVGAMTGYVRMKWDPDFGEFAEKDIHFVYNRKDNSLQLTDEGLRLLEERGVLPSSVESRACGEIYHLIVDRMLPLKETIRRRSVLKEALKEAPQDTLMEYGDITPEKLALVVGAVGKFRKNVHYTAARDPAEPTCATTQYDVTPEGFALLAKQGAISQPSPDAGFLEAKHDAENLVRARYILKRNEDYVVDASQGEPKAVLVDRVKGRLSWGKRLEDGLHEAIEAVEGIPIVNGSVEMARTSQQKVWNSLPWVAGMTGTAMTSAKEFWDVYRLEAVPLPTDIQWRWAKGDLERTVEKVKLDDGTQAEQVVYTDGSGKRAFERVDYPTILVGRMDFSPERLQAYSAVIGRTLDSASRQDVAYLTEYLVIASEAIGMLAKGRPVLVHSKEANFTTELGRMVEHLIGNPDELEGLYRNMDLAGMPDAEGLARLRAAKVNLLYHEKHSQEADIVSEAGEEGAYTGSTGMAGRGVDITLSEGSRLAGGIHNIIAQMPSNRRQIDQQRGRVARQGDPGSSRMIISYADPMMAPWTGNVMTSLVERFMRGDADTAPYISAGVTRSFNDALEKIEGADKDAREALLKRENAVDSRRVRLLEIRTGVRDMSDEVMKDYVLGCYREAISQNVEANTDSMGRPDVKAISRYFSERVPFRPRQEDTGKIMDAQRLDVSLTPELARLKADNAVEFADRAGAYYETLLRKYAEARKISPQLAGDVGKKLAKAAVSDRPAETLSVPGPHQRAMEADYMKQVESFAKEHRLNALELARAVGYVRASFAAGRLPPKIEVLRESSLDLRVPLEKVAEWLKESERDPAAFADLARAHYSDVLTDYVADGTIGLKDLTALRDKAMEVVSKPGVLPLSLQITPDLVKRWTDESKGDRGALAGRATEHYDKVLKDYAERGVITQDEYARVGPKLGEFVSDPRNPLPAELRMELPFGVANVIKFPRRVAHRFSFPEALPLILEGLSAGEIEEKLASYAEDAYSAYERFAADTALNPIGFSDASHNALLGIVDEGWKTYLSETKDADKKTYFHQGRDPEQLRVYQALDAFDRVVSAIPASTADQYFKRLGA